jgi:K+ transporter
VSDKPENGGDSTESSPRLPKLALAALGIVYGDIGTSPIYALRECFYGDHPVPPNMANVLGLVSLVFWALLVVISAKYLLYVMRADNRGEGGIVALVALLNPWRSSPWTRRWILMLLGLFGGALLYGDGTITPAISVLSALEGLKVATPSVAPFVVPATVLILVGLFWIQRHGTGRIGVLFGPILALWFLALAALGVRGILMHPAVLAAVNPVYAARFLLENGGVGFLTLGSVFLAVTGGEAMYADMGHFGLRPIRLVGSSSCCRRCC